MTLVRTNNWILKATTQKVISVLPGAETINAFLRRNVTKSLVLSAAQFSDGLHLCRKHLANFFTARGNCEPGFTVFEVGTGWYPIIPIGLYVCGASTITTLDIRSLLTVKNLRETLRLFSQSALNGSLKKTLPWADENRIRDLQSIYCNNTLTTTKDILAAMGIVPILADARKVDLGTGSIDFIFSNSSLQHVPLAVLPEVFSEFRRLAAPSAVMSLHVGLGDRYAFIDPSVTIFNFLRFSNRAWTLIDNSLVPNNRLRVSDYRQLHLDHGWVIRAEDTTYGSAKDLEKVPLAKEFRAYTRQDLLALRTWIVSSAS